MYEDVATTEIVVEAYWTGTWNGITFPELPVPTTETVPLEVREVQAVRQR